MTHLPHASWCDICVPARAADPAHYSKEKEREPYPAAPVVVQMDYTFGSDTAERGKDLKVLGMINDRTGYGSATAVPSKGAKHPFPVKWAERALARSSGMRFVIQTDPENSAGQVAAEVASTAQKPTSTRKTPVGSHESNGHIERHFRTLHGQIRATRLGYEKAVNATLDGDSPAMTWVVRHSSFLLPRFQTWYGIAPYRREHSRDYDGLLCNFGERVWGRVPKALNKRKWKARWFPGRWLGKDENSDEHLVLSQQTGEVTRTRAVKRRPQQSSSLRRTPCFAEWPRHRGT